MSGTFEIELLEQLQRLLAEGKFTATYKLAVLLGLVDLSVEALPGTDTFTTRQLAEKVAQLYWPQVVRFEGVAVRQSPQSSSIAGAIAELRRCAEAERSAPLLVSSCRALVPEKYDLALRKVEEELIAWPLPRVQQIGREEHRFLYELDWTLDEAERKQGALRGRVRAYQRGESAAGFDNRIRMKPRVVEALARFHGLVRELVETRWVRKVRDLNGFEERPIRRKRSSSHVFAVGALDRSLHGHLFGFKRGSLVSLGGPLRALHGGRCFYCDERITKVHIDHFLPWARYPDNRLLNLVPAHPTCNGSKATFLAAVPHLSRWLHRFTDPSIRAALEAIGEEEGWPIGGTATLGASRHAYAQQPDGANLWRHAGKPATFEQLERSAIDRLFNDSLRIVGEAA